WTTSETPTTCSTSRSAASGASAGRPTRLATTPRRPSTSGAPSARATSPRSSPSARRASASP
ncbi:MAG: hypothetical protein AVDCRST_MAG38-1896, partial [uncultured Solirubrobacteraceae bacterium]